MCVAYMYMYRLHANTCVYMRGVRLNTCTKIGMARSPTRAPLIDPSSTELQNMDEPQVDANRLNEENATNPDSQSGSAGQTSFPTYGSVQSKTEKTPPLKEKNVHKRRHRTSSVVSLSSFGDVSGFYSLF